MATRSGRVAALLLLLAALLAGADLRRGRVGVAASKQPSPEARRELVSAWDRPQLLAALYLGQFGNPGVPNRIAVKENPSAPGVPLFEVDFTTGWPTSPKRVLTYPEGYSYLSMGMMGGNMLLTVWSSASEGVVQVFHLVNGGASLVFEKSGWATVEHWHDTLLITRSETTAAGRYRYTTSQIWGWDGQKYALAATVPYRRRLQALVRLGYEDNTK